MSASANSNNRSFACLSKSSHLALSRRGCSSFITLKDLWQSTVRSSERGAAVNSSEGGTILAAFTFFPVFPDLDGIMFPVSSVREISLIASFTEVVHKFFFLPRLFEWMGWRKNVILYLVFGSWKRNRNPTTPIIFPFAKLLFSLFIRLLWKSGIFRQDSLGSTWLTDTLTSYLSAMSSASVESWFLQTNICTKWSWRRSGKPFLLRLKFRRSSRGFDSSLNTGASLSLWLPSPEFCVASEGSKESKFVVFLLPICTKDASIFKFKPEASSLVFITSPSPLEWQLWTFLLSQSNVLESKPFCTPSSKSRTLLTMSSGETHRLLSSEFRSSEEQNISVLSGQELSRRL